MHKELYESLKGALWVANHESQISDEDFESLEKQLTEYAQLCWAYGVLALKSAQEGRIAMLVSIAACQVIDDAKEALASFPEETRRALGECP